MPDNMIFTVVMAGMLLGVCALVLGHAWMCRYHYENVPVGRPIGWSRTTSRRNRD